jgi:hypothetical protein
VVKQAALALQAQAGCPVTFSHTGTATQKGIYTRWSWNTAKKTWAARHLQLKRREADPPRWSNAPALTKP